MPEKKPFSFKRIIAKTCESLENSRDNFDVVLSHAKFGLASVVLLGAMIGVASYLPQASAQLSEQEISETEARLQAELQRLEVEIAEQRGLLNGAQQKTAGFDRDISVLENKIAETRLQLRANELRLGKITDEISIKSATINDLEYQIGNHKDSLSELVQNLHEFGDFSMVEVFLANENLSAFFEDFDNLVAFRELMNRDLKEFKEARELIEQERNSLASQREQEQAESLQIAARKDSIESNQEQVKELRQASRSDEVGYEQVVAEREQRAAKIRAQLFSLRDSADINFGQAYDYAKQVSAITGVRTAFILAVIKQESDLGRNVGRCNLPNDPPEYKWNAIMPGPNSNSNRDDQAAYLRIVKALGISPESKPLSCPLNIGWGGAMGPAQFIPTTWEAYGPRVSAQTGRPSNPWNPFDAFLASATFLSDLGANIGTYAAEQEAAARYYAGGNWQANGLGYAASVLQKAANFERTIDSLEGI